LGHKGHKVDKVLKVQQVQVLLVLKAHRALKDRLVHKVRRDLKVGRV